MIRLLSSFLLCFMLPSFLLAQMGGNNTYEFLNLTSSARVAALGGNQIAVKDDDLFLGIENPALLNKEMDNKLAMTYVGYLADINYGVASYAKHFDSVGTFNLGVKYIDYGDFIETDQAGNETGGFTAGEYAFVLGYGRQLDSNFSVGANIKTIYSSFYDYSSLGIAADLGLTYHLDKHGLTVSLLGKNMGRQLSTYVENQEKEDLPFEIQMGVSKRLDKVPIRFGLIFQHLQQWDLQYENPNDKQESSILTDANEQEDKEPGFFDNLGRHIIFNAEFMLTENFNIRFGYNYLRRAELKIDEQLGTVGISWGVGMRISKFHLSYGRSAYHQAGATNTFSVSTRLSDFIN
ncbi:MAG: type IX secretion system protein PorQ [Vicingaceae bacterium]